LTKIGFPLPSGLHSDPDSPPAICCSAAFSGGCLASLYYAILATPSFEHALIHRLASRLSCPSLPAGSLARVLLEPVRRDASISAVTLGGSGIAKVERHPKIRTGVLIGAGARQQSVRIRCV